jgi:hypothetical protein
MKLVETGGTRQPAGLVPFATKMAEGEVEAFDLAEPAFLMGPAATGDEVRLDLVEAADHRRAHVEHRAADACVLVHAWGSVRPSAAA